jgi:predicted MPP superfamily phosphohydrolase
MAVLALIGGLYLVCVASASWVRVERVRVPLGLGVRIAQVSDLHVERVRVSPDRLLRLLASLAPDLLVLTGDFLERARSLPRLRPYLDALARLGVPMFAVLGNHDYELGDVAPLVALLARHGVRVLRNEHIDMGRFALVGVDDWCSGHSDPERAFAGVPAGRPRVVITHDPNVVLTLREPFAYLMAGHFHGGQFAFPFVFKVQPLGPLPAMGIVSGLHRAPGGPYYISRGLGQSGVNLRFLVPAELTLHSL